MSRAWDIAKKAAVKMNKIGGFLGAVAGGIFAAVAVTGLGPLGMVACVAVGAVMGGVAGALASGAVGALAGGIYGGLTEDPEKAPKEKPAQGVSRSVASNTLQSNNTQLGQGEPSGEYQSGEYQNRQDQTYAASLQEDTLRPASTPRNATADRGRGGRGQVLKITRAAACYAGKGRGNR